jgi:predicted  nucleic acid-binding Zn-ribbon protein
MTNEHSAHFSKEEMREIIRALQELNVYANGIDKKNRELAKQLEDLATYVCNAEARITQLESRIKDLEHRP